MATTDSRPVPRKNVAYRVIFPIWDGAGSLVTAAAGLDSEVSVDCGTFTDATSEATEIATSSGVYFLDLTAGEMNGDSVAVIVKTSTVGAKTTVITMYPEEAGDYRADVTHFGGSAGTFSGGRPEVNTTHIAGSAVSTSSAQIGVNVVNAAGTAWASGAITAASIAADAIGASELAADAVTEIRSLASGTSDSGTTTTMVDAARTEADTDYWAGALIVFTSGNIAGQARLITAFNAATDTITYTPATTQAAATQTYEIWPNAEALRPTTAGRTLDVSSTGEAGVDWANVGSPTTTLNLSGTTVKTATDVEAKLPTSLVSGRIDASVGAMAANVLTATAINADAITDAKVASDVTIASVTGSVGSVATGGIAAASFASGAINAAAIAADAIGASELAADAATEIGTAVWATAARTLTANTNLNDLSAAGVRAAVGLASANLDTQLSTIDDFLDTEIAAIKAKTDNLPTDPADESLIIAATDAIFSRIGAPAGASIAADIAGVSGGSGLDAAGVRAAVGLASANLDTQLDALPTNAELATALGTADDAVLARLGTPAGVSIAADIAGVSGGGGLDAAGVRAAVGLASANLDTQLSTIDNFLDTEIADIRARLPAALVGGRIDANMGSVNSVDVDGVGSPVDPWGPAA